jgi:hypothetical protein
VIRRIRSGVSQRFRRVFSQERAPVAAAVEAIAVYMHWTHMTIEGYSSPALTSLGTGPAEPVQGDVVI